MIGAGISPQQAQSLLGLTVIGLTAAGNSQATAKAITGDVIVLTTVAASTGVILPASSDEIVPSDRMLVANYGANALAIYPPVGGKINNGAANAAISLAANKVAELISLGYGNWLALVGS